MKRVIAFAGVLVAFSAPALADPTINVDGAYRCVHLCAPGYQGARTFIGQSGTQINLVNEYGEAATGFVEFPRRIWIDRWNAGAMISPDAMKIQFDSGKVWLRELPVVRYPSGRHYR
jgi:hypothetical protein